MDQAEHTIRVRNPRNDNERTLVGIVAGGGFFNPDQQEILLSAPGDPRASGNEMEFESIVAHEFAHAAAGLPGGTPESCKDDKSSCAVDEQNKVHRDIGFREREGYGDTKSFKKKPSGGGAMTDLRISYLLPGPIVLLLAVSIVVSSCRSGPRESGPGEHLTLEEAIRIVRARSALPPVFVVEGEIVDSLDTALRESVVRAVVPSMTPRHCEERFQVGGECRPIILVFLRRR